MSETNTAEITDDQMAEHLAQWDASGPQIPQEEPAPETDAQVEELAEQGTETGDGQSPEEEPAETGTESEEKSEEAKPEEKTEQPEAEQKTLTKADKEKVRQENTWKKIEAEKQAIAQAKAEIEAQKAELALKAVKKPETLKDEKGFTAEDYEKFADQIEKDGDHPQSTIELARLKARQLRDQEKFQQAETHKQAVELVVKQTIEKYPDLQKPDSAIAKQMQAIYERDKSDGFYGTRPDGIAKMAELAEARVKADSVPVLEKKLSELTKEVARLTKLTTPSKGGPTSIGKAASSAVPSEADVEAYMKELDGKGVLIG